MAKIPFTEKMDDAADKKAGIKQGSKKDMALDKKRGLPASVVAKGAKPVGNPFAKPKKK